MPLLFPTKLPFAPGASPFHIKGSVYVSTLRRTAETAPDGLARAIAALDDPALQAFFRQKFLAGGWYDYLPILMFARITNVLVVGSTKEQALEERLQWTAKLHAEQDVGGLYKFLLRFTSPEAAMQRMPGIYRQYYDFGRVETTILGEGVADSVVHGWPELAARFFQIYNREFNDRVLVLAGARDTKAVYAPFEPDGETAGVPLVRMRIRTTWTT